MIAFAVPCGLAGQTVGVSLAKTEEKVLFASLPDAPAALGQLGGSSSSINGLAQGDSDTSGQPTPKKEHKHVGIISAYTASYSADAPPLRGSEKMRLALQSSLNPLTFATAFVVAGYHEAKDDYGAGYGWGAQGYGKRVGAAYLDTFTSTMIGSGVLPTLLRQDPRYFRLGQGTFRHRVLYAAVTSTLICKGDRSRKWQPNYSALGGAIGSAAISNIYYPADQSGLSQTAQNGAIVAGEGALFGIFREFWPDVSRKLFHRNASQEHGLAGER